MKPLASDTAEQRAAKYSKYFTRRVEQSHAPYRIIREVDSQSQVNDLLSANWTLLSVCVAGGDPQCRNERFKYLLGWRHEADPVEPEHARGW